MSGGGDVRGFLAELGLAVSAHGAADNATLRCPVAPDVHAHGDRRPSFSVSLTTGAWRCWACGRQGGAYDLARALGRSPADAMALLDRYELTNGDRPDGGQRAPDRPPLAVTEADARRYADALAGNAAALDRLAEPRGWTHEAVERLGLGLDGDRVTFPVRDRGGMLVGLLRYAPNPAERNGEPKMLAAPGSRRELWPAPEAVEGDPVWIAEGEPDAVTFAALGLAAVSVPGTSAWRPDWAERFAGRRVVIGPDADDPGRELADRIASDLAGVADDVRVLDLHALAEGRSGYDVGDLLAEVVADKGAEQGRQAARELLLRAAENTPPHEAPAGARAADIEPTTGARAPGEAKSSEGASGRRLTFTPASAIPPTRPRWLWQGRVPLGGATILFGWPGLGKSTTAAWLAAQLSQGRLDGDAREAAPTLWLGFEEARGSVIVPRLLAADGDTGRVEFADAERDGARALVELPGDLDGIAERVGQLGARLLVVDPLVAALGAEVRDSHNDRDVRVALAPLAQLADEHDLAVLAVMHRPKTTRADNAIANVAGSGGFAAAARSVLAFGADPAHPDDETRCVIAHAKCNVGPRAESLACRIEGAALDRGGEPLTASRLVIDGPSDADAGDVLAGSDADEREATDEAAEWLADKLSDGDWHASRRVKQDARREGITPKTLRLARERVAEARNAEGFPRRTEWRLRAVVPSRQGTTGNGKAGHDCENRLATGDRGPSAPPVVPYTDTGHDWAKTDLATAADEARLARAKRHASAPNGRPYDRDGDGRLTLDEFAEALIGELGAVEQPPNGEGQAP